MKQNWKIAAVVSAVAVVVVVSFLIATSLLGNIPATQAAGGAPADPQHLLIPRWFLQSLTVNGQEVSLPEKQMSLQFKPDGSANGWGSCNDFSTSYQVSADGGEVGSLTFDPVISTKMACDPGMDAESAYFQALGSVKTFQFVDYKLVLSSEDGQTVLRYAMPPK
jgi:heat shock protein HslJ